MVVTNLPPALVPLESLTRHTPTHPVRIESIDDEATRVIREVEEHSGPVNELRWLQSGRWLATASDDHTVRLLDWRNEEDDPEAQRTLIAHEEAVWTLSSSDDGRWLVAGALDGLVQIWDLHSAAVETHEAVLRDHARGIRSISSDNDRWIATVSSDPARSALLWDLHSTGSNDAPRPVAQQLTEDSGRTTCLDWHPSKNEFIAGNQEGVVTIFRVGSPNTAQSTFNLGSRVIHVSFNRNGRWLSAVSERGVLRLQTAEFDSGQVLPDNQKNADASTVTLPPESKALTCCLHPVWSKNSAELKTL